MKVRFLCWPMLFSFVLYPLANVYFVSVGQRLFFSFKSKTEGRKLTCKFQNFALCLTLLSNLEKQESIVLQLINNIGCVN